MNKLFLYFLLSFVSHACVAQNCPVTQPIVNDFIEKAKAKSLDYLNSLNTLVMKDADNETKTRIKGELMSNYFFTPNTLIEDKIADVSKDQVTVEDYLNTLINHFGNRDADFVFTILSTDSLYYDKEKKEYLTRVVVSKKFQYIKSNEKTGDDIIEKQFPQIVSDIFFRGKSSCSNPKISAIQTHDADFFSDRLPVKIVSQEVADGMLSKGKPHLAFEISPLNAIVAIDGIEINQSKGAKIETIAGRHNITISAQNFHPMSFDVNVGDTNTLYIHKILEEKIGTVSFTTSDPKFNGHSLKIKKGANIGVLPVYNYKLPYGTHTIRIIGSLCYIGKKFTITLSESNPEVTINVSLASAKAAYNVASGVGSIFGVKVDNPCK